MATPPSRDTTRGRAHRDTGSDADLNRARILRHLQLNGICSRAQLAKTLHLTPAAITKITARLIDAGILTETGDIEGINNRRSIGLRINAAQFHVLGVKFARTRVQFGIFDLDGTPLHLDDIPTPNDGDTHTALATIRERITSMLHDDTRIIAVGIAVPGPYLRDIGQAAIISSMPDWRDINFHDEFAHAFSVPVYFEQDARAGALAQRLFNPTVTADCIAYYLVGEGVGLGVLDHSTLLNGSRGAATEIGHISVNIDGIPCECGNNGCLERYCSAVAIHQRITDSHLIDGSERMTRAQACEALFAAARQGNPEARAIMHDVARYVAQGCITIINAFNPEHIVIGDIVSEAGATFLDDVRAYVAQHAIAPLNESTTISLTTLSTDASVLGAASIAITQFLHHPSRFCAIT